MLSKLPNGVVDIGNKAFCFCPKITLNRIPSSVQRIGDEAFAGCSGLTNITFEAIVKNMYLTVFSNCPNLTIIRVPWSEGAVSGAPWGAANATIIYDYTNKEEN